MNLMSMTDFLLIYLILVMDGIWKNFKKYAFSPSKMTKIEVTTVNNGISYNYNVFFYQ